MVLLPSFFDGLCEGPDGGPFQHTQAPFVLDDFRALCAELYPAVLAKLLRKQEAPCLPKRSTLLAGVLPAAPSLWTCSGLARIPILPTRDPKQCIVRRLRGIHSTLYTLCFTLRTPHSTIYTLRSLLYTFNSTFHTPHFTLHILHFTLHTSHLTLYTPHSTLYTSHYTLPTLHSTLCTPRSTLHTSHSTVYTLHSTLYTPHFALYTPHFTFHTLHSRL